MTIYLRLKERAQGNDLKSLGSRIIDDTLRQVNVWHYFTQAEVKKLAVERMREELERKERLSL